MKKKPVKYVELNQEAVKYCFKQDYKIYPITTDNTNYKVQVEKDGHKRLFDEKYNPETIHKGVADMYNRIYNKHINKKQ